MAAPPPSPLFPAVFRFSTPHGWPHAKMPAEAPIEQLTARPPVASPGAGGEACNCCFGASLKFHGEKRASSVRQRWIGSRPGSERIEEWLLEPTDSAVWRAAASPAFGTEEHSAAVHDVFRGMCDHARTFAPACP